MGKPYAGAPGERGLPAQIAGRIGRRIIQGELKPGDTLPKELDLLAELQVSRSSLREAFALLSSNGFIEAKQRIGTRVRPPERWNTLDPMVIGWHSESGDPAALAQELFEIRFAVEPLAARLAAQRARPEDIARIRAALQAMGEDQRNPTRAMQADVDFHMQVIAAAHNRFLMPVGSVIRAALEISVPRTFEKFGGMSRSMAMHADIARAIEQSRPEAAARAATRLLEDTYQRNFA